MSSSYCQKDSFLLRSSTLSVWSMKVISQSFIPWCLSSSKWAWNHVCSTVFNETPMGWLVIVKSRAKTFSTPCVLFRACFAWKKIHNIAAAIKLSGLIQYSLGVLKDLNVSVVTTRLHISHVEPPHDLKHPFFFTRVATFALTRISFRHICSSKPNYRNMKDSIIGTIEGFFEVGIENWPVWDLNQQPLNSVQTL